ncbi:MAG: hypothetical protein AAGJ28_22030 [Pseudomonadota bacterium]
MSFFRPEATDVVKRIAEPAVYAAIAGWGLIKGWQILDRGGWVGAVLLVIGALAALALAGSITRTVYRWRVRRAGPGVVTIHEGRISFFGPYGGAIIALDALTTVEIEVTPNVPETQKVAWTLADELGQRVTIPAGASGADKLLDRLGSLPGFDSLAVLRATRATPPQHFTVWARAGQARVELS